MTRPISPRIVRKKPVYTSEQINLALGIMSGRIDPCTDLRFFDDAQKLHGDLVSAHLGGDGNPGPTGHRLKAEEILLHLISRAS